MATQICDGLCIAMPAMDHDTPISTRTYTATRSLRMYDLKALQLVDPGQAARVLEVWNGAHLCIHVCLAAPAADVVWRLGQDALDTVDDAHMLVVAGGTCVFSTDCPAGNTLAPTLYCYPL